jgi:hypothetical protein
MMTARLQRTTRVAGTIPTLKPRPLGRAIARDINIDSPLSAMPTAGRFGAVTPTGSPQSKNAPLLLITDSLECDLASICTHRLRSSFSHPLYITQHNCRPRVKFESRLEQELSERGGKEVWDMKLCMELVQLPASFSDCSPNKFL